MAAIKYQIPGTDQWVLLENGVVVDTDSYSRDEIDEMFANFEGGGAGMTMDLLWENPDPTAEFSAQTIELDLSEYDAIFMTGYLTNNRRMTVSAWCNMGESGVLMYAEAETTASVGEHTGHRDFTVTETGITIQGSYHAHGGSVYTHDGQCVPCHIYGVKLASSSGGSTVTPENVYTKDEIDAMLANAGGGMELLWTNNDDPINMFNGQTIEMDLSEHDAIFVEFIISASDTGNGSAFVVKNESHTTIIPVITDGSRVSRTTSFDDNGVTFSNGAHNGGSGNGFVIPVKIYGIKNGSSISTSAGIGMDLLWKNENESAEFAAQNIEIYRDSYDEIVVYTTSGDIVIPKGSTVPYLISQNSFYDYDLGGQTVYGMYSWSREIVTSTDGVLKFADCVGVGGENQDDNIGAVPYGAFNHQCKPIAIYGRNLTGATAPTTQTGIQMELLWENASLTSDFTAQTIELDLSAYYAVFVVSNYMTVGGFMMIGGQGVLSCMNLHTNNTALDIENRRFYVEAHGITFEDAYFKSSSMIVANDRCKPFRIYGIKGVS